MAKQILKALPLVFLIILIGSLMILSGVNFPSWAETAITAAELISISCIIELLIFYVDFKKNQSVSSAIGLLGVGLYIILAIVVLVMSETMLNSSNYDSIKETYKLIKNIKLAGSITKEIIAMLKYFSIFSLISHKSTDGIAEISKIIAYFSTFVYHTLNIAYDVVDYSKIPNFVSIIREGSNELIKIAVFAFVIYELFTEEEVRQAEIKMERASNPQQAPAFQPNGPRFRNPALEAQEARLAQQNQNNQVNQPVTPTTIVNQQPVQTQTTMMPTPSQIAPNDVYQMPPINNNNLNS
jgi:hypothetical protein